METKTIKISKENYLWLLKLSSELQKEHERPVSFDFVLTSFKEGKMKKKKNIMDFAGIWKDVSDKDVGDLKKSMTKLRKTSTRELLKK